MTRILRFAFLGLIGITLLLMGCDRSSPTGICRGPFPTGGDVTKPEKIYAPQPQYTEEARRARIQGVVIVQALIDCNGFVTDVKVLKSLPMGLTEAAVDAIRRWEFKPATQNGVPVSVYYNLTVNFRLQ